MNVFVQGLNGRNDYLTLRAVHSLSELKRQLESVYGGSCMAQCYLTSVGGRLLKSLEGQDELGVRLCARLAGGKGGFGQSLKTQGGRVSKKKRGTDGTSSSSSSSTSTSSNGTTTGSSNTALDKYKTVDGKSVKSIRLAKELKEYERVQAAAEQRRLADKKQRLHKIVSGSGPSTYKFTDVEYLEKSESLLEEMQELNARACRHSAPESRSSLRPNQRAANFFGDESEDESEDETSKDG